MLNIVECDINRQSSESSAPTVASGGSLLTESSGAGTRKKGKVLQSQSYKTSQSFLILLQKRSGRTLRRCPGTELQSALVHALVPLATRPLLFSVLNDTLYAIISITK